MTQSEIVQLAFDIAVPIAKEQAAIQANGEFLKILLEIIKELLPILLELLKPKTPS